MILRPFRILNMILVCALLAGCGDGKKGPSASDGGQHGGGGEYDKSTAKDVHAALDQAIELTTSTDPRKNIFAKFYISKHVSRMDEVTTADQVPKYILFPEASLAYRGSLPQRDTFFFRLEDSPALMAFADKSRVVRQEKGACRAPDKSHPSASVSELTPRATICFSIAELRAIPRGALLGQILGLVIHEAVHMMGQKEEEARKHQADFLSYFERVESEIKNIDVETRVVHVSTVAQQHLDSLQFAADKKSVALFAGQLKDLRRLFTSGLNFTLDPVRMQMAGEPVRPDLFDDFARAYLAVLFDTASFDAFLPSVEKGEIKAPETELDPSAFKKIRSDFETRLEALRINSIAYLKGSLQAVCASPNYNNAPKLDLFNPGLFGVPEPGRPGTLRREMPYVDTRLTRFSTDLPLFRFPPRGECENPAP